MKRIVILMTFVLLTAVAYADDAKEQTKTDESMLIAYVQDYCFRCAVRAYSDVTELFVLAPNKYAAEDIVMNIAYQKNIKITAVACSQVARGCR